MYSNFKSKDGTRWEYTHSPIRPDMDQSGQHTNGPAPLWMKKADDIEWKMVDIPTLKIMRMHWSILTYGGWYGDKELEAFLV